MEILRGRDLEPVEVTQEMLDARAAEILEQAQAHVGEPVLIFDQTEQLYTVQAGIVKEQAEVKSGGLFKVITLCELHLGVDGSRLQEFKHPLNLSFSEVYESFQLYRPLFDVRNPGLPKVEVIFGSEAIARWVIEGVHPRGCSYPAYIQLMHRMGLEPVLLPEGEPLLEQARASVSKRLLELALEQMQLGVKIEAVFKSIGHGPHSTHGGLAISMAPESKGEASLRTSGDRKKLGQNQMQIERLKQQLIELGVDEQSFYLTIASMLGLELKQGQE